MPEAKQLRNDMMQKALQKVLEEAKVPAHQHLKLLDAFSKKLAEHEQDRAQHKQLLQKYEQAAVSHQQRNKKADELLSKHTEEGNKRYKGFDEGIERAKAIQKGDKGDPGKDADEIKIIETILKRIPIPKNGDNGNPGKDAILDEKKIVSLMIETLRKEPTIDMSHIKGAQSFIKDRVKYRVEELMHGGGGSKGGGAPQIPTGTVNGINLTFIAATTPTIIFTEGGHFTNGFGVTITGLTIVFATGLAPQQWIYYL